MYSIQLTGGAMITVRMNDGTTRETTIDEYTDALAKSMAAIIYGEDYEKYDDIVDSYTELLNHVSASAYNLLADEYEDMVPDYLED